jgi:AraC-like DNA-binding protein
MSEYASSREGTAGDSGCALSGADTPAALLRLVDEALAMFDVDQNTSLCYMLRALVLCRSQYPEDGGVLRPVRGGLAGWQVSRMMDYIDSHLAERIKGKDLAALVNLSLGQMSRTFTISFGTSPLRYIRQRRIELACAMMQATRAPLSQVAAAVGMCDEGHLCRVFRRVIGMSPGTWRRANACKLPATHAG